MNINKKAKIIIWSILGIVVLFASLYYVFFLNMFVIINDTPERVTGMVVGETSPAKLVDVAAHKTKVVNFYFSTPYYLGELSVNQVHNYGIFKVIKISELQKE